MRMMQDWSFWQNLEEAMSSSGRLSANMLMMILYGAIIKIIPIINPGGPGAIIFII